jgi:poly(3-hydroxybutyrate) depolymerase
MKGEHHMKKLVILVVALLPMSLMQLTGTASAAAPTTAGTADVVVQERKAQRTLVKRNAAAKKLKADLDKKNAAQSSAAK